MTTAQDDHALKTPDPHMGETPFQRSHEGGQSVDPQWVAISELATTFKLRSRPLDLDHVAVLADVYEHWPPIAVQATTNVVVDGVHRVAAAKRLGLRSILATMLESTGDEALVIESVRRNNMHGLPLVMEDRESAAGRILSVRPSWSDRKVALMCGLSVGRVARLRGRVLHVLPEASDEVRARTTDVREGSDGRKRPTNSVLLRTRAAEAIKRDPTASLRSIAASVGTSPETVRDVRKRLERGDDPVPPGARRSGGSLPAGLQIVDLSASRLTDDQAYTSVSDRAEFAAWFDAHDLNEEWKHFVESVPLGRVYEVIDESSRRSQVWADFAAALNCRLRAETRSVK